MSLISILLVTVAILAFVFGMLIFIGSSRADRLRSFWFSFATIGAMLWTISIAAFLALSPEATNVEHWIYGIYIMPMFMIVGMLGYSSWRYKTGKAFTIFNLCCAVALSALMVYDKSLLYESYTLSVMGNVVNLTKGLFYIIYMAFFFVADGMFLVYSWYSYRHTRSKHAKNAILLLMVGFGITGVFTLVTDLVLPLMGNYKWIWVGSLSIGATIAAYFYVILKYRMISVASRWLQLATYAVVGFTGVAIYMLLFYTVFTALFKIPNPSTSVLVLNFLMIVIVLLLIPVINEVNANLRSMVMVGQVDIAYVIKRLNHLASKNVDLRDLAGFLADHLHFAYVGFIINGRLYGSKPLAMSTEELSSITHLRQTTNGVWQEPNKTVQKIFDELGLKAVAELRNAKGKTFGQLLVGKPVGKSSFERRDLIQLEMIINLVATVIDSEKHLRA